jgi:hypothetical protein
MLYTTYQEYETNKKETMNNSYQSTFSAKRFTKNTIYIVRTCTPKQRIAVAFFLLGTTGMMYLGVRSLVLQSIDLYNVKADGFAYERVVNDQNLIKQFAYEKTVPVIDAEAASGVVAEAAKQGAVQGSRETVESYLTSPKAR